MQPVLHNHATSEWRKLLRLPRLSIPAEWAAPLGLQILWKLSDTAFSAHSFLRFDLLGTGNNFSLQSYGNATYTKYIKERNSLLLKTMNRGRYTYGQNIFLWNSATLSEHLFILLYTCIVYIRNHNHWLLTEILNHISIVGLDGPEVVHKNKLHDV